LGIGFACRWLGLAFFGIGFGRLGDELERFGVGRGFDAGRFGRGFGGRFREGRLTSRRLLPERVGRFTFLRLRFEPEPFFFIAFSSGLLYP
jgi:hypothetical protein